MTSPKSNSDELEGLLRDAVVVVRETTVDESLVERCRQSAIKLGSPSTLTKSSTSDNSSSWRVAVGLAASILLVINIAQAYASLPSANRELAAIVQSTPSERLYVYSDLRIEVASLEQSTNLRSEP